MSNIVTRAIDDAAVAQLGVAHCLQQRGAHRRIVEVVVEGFTVEQQVRAF